MGEALQTLQRHIDSVLHQWEDVMRSVVLSRIPGNAMGCQHPLIMALNFPRRKKCDTLSTFNAIDTSQRGYITVSDLKAYARDNNIPDSYAPAFLAAAGVDQQGGNQQLTYTAFERFVRARERGLREAFDRLDVHKTGTLTKEGLQQALETVTIECASSGRVYRCPDRCIQQLLTSIQSSNALQRGVTYCEFRKFFMLLPQQELMVEYWLGRACPARCDVGSCVVLRRKTDQAGSLTQQHGQHDALGVGAAGHLLAGALAGAVSRTATAPLETVRLCSMAGTLQGSTNLLHAIHGIAQRDGSWQALFRGNGANVLKSAPQKAIDFYTFEAFKAAPWLNSIWGAGSTGATLVAAGLAGATSASILYPLEVVRSRITCDPAFAGTSVPSAMRRIISTQGPGALYRGWMPSVAAIIPEAAIVYGCFDLLKASYCKMRNKDDAGIVASLVFGVTASFMGQVVAFPLETVSRRLQLSGGASGGVSTVARGIWASEGVAGFYRGLPAATARTVPMALVSFGTYELVRKWLLAVHLAARAPSGARQRLPPSRDAIRRSFMRNTRQLKTA